MKRVARLIVVGICALMLTGCQRSMNYVIENESNFVGLVAA